MSIIAAMGAGYAICRCVDLGFGRDWHRCSLNAIVGLLLFGLAISLGAQP